MSLHSLRPDTAGLVFIALYILPVSSSSLDHTVACRWSILVAGVAMAAAAALAVPRKIRLPAAVLLVGGAAILLFPGFGARDTDQRDHAGAIRAYVMDFERDPSAVREWWILSEAIDYLRSTDGGIPPLDWLGALASESRMDYEFDSRSAPWLEPALRAGYITREWLAERGRGNRRLEDLAGSDPARFLYLKSWAVWDARRLGAAGGLSESVRDALARHAAPSLPEAGDRRFFVELRERERLAAEIGRPGILDGAEERIRAALALRCAAGRSRREAGFGFHGAPDAAETLAAAPYLERVGLPEGASRHRLANFLRGEIAFAEPHRAWNREREPPGWERDRLAAAHLAIARLERAGVVPPPGWREAVFSWSVPAAALALAVFALAVLLRAPDIPRPPRPASHGGRAYARFAGRES